MHKAPSVTFPVGPCLAYERVLWGCLVLVAFAGLWVTLRGQPPSAFGVALAVGLWLIAVCAVTLHLLRWPSGRLTWGGEMAGHEVGEWLWQPQRGRAALVTVRVVWHGLGALGLRLDNGRGQAVWVWARARQSPHEWLPFRRALISSTWGN
ncbi:MAG: hypothetical protein RL297_418 [Pseudomonadota bacterium]|jgi:hypothetical protein